jgi:hypothetical protein
MTASAFATDIAIAETGDRHVTPLLAFHTSRRLLFVFGDIHPLVVDGETVCNGFVSLVRGFERDNSMAEHLVRGSAGFWFYPSSPYDRMRLEAVSLLDLA